MAVRPRAGATSREAMRLVLPMSAIFMVVVFSDPMGAEDACDGARVYAAVDLVGRSTRSAAREYFCSSHGLVRSPHPLGGEALQFGGDVEVGVGVDDHEGRCSTPASAGGHGERGLAHRRWVAAISAVVPAGTSAQTGGGTGRADEESLLPVEMGRRSACRRACCPGARRQRKALSPVSGERADVHERRTRRCRTAASVITTPPYEWPTSTTGPSMAATTSRRWRHRRRRCGADWRPRSRRSLRRRRPMTPFQLADSAKAPCTSAMTGGWVIPDAAALVGVRPSLIVHRSADTRQ